MKYLALFILFTSLILTGCTPTDLNQVLQPPAPTTSPTLTPSASPTSTINPSTTPIPYQTPVEIKSTPKKTISPSPSVLGANTQSINSNSTISINNSIKVINNDGKSYAEVNGQQVELDSNGCYIKEENGSKTNICINSN